ncbi:nucleotide-diphospho-sugar transferase [Irpex rosettiformis]|uniref:Nucleotide-diphospho-sugar transferase n=1 Tax=Irpex rosettiformis TaxID=378272 RepID=A0ACB8U9R6_9APHY|nr:nucleotide-diphospho-sugar transferase [Irpex rosettiformis]
MNSLWIRLSPLRRHYLPLGVDDDGYHDIPSPLRKRRRLVVALAALVAVSLLFNVLSLVKLSRSSSLQARPLDDFQNLDTSPLIRVQSSSSNGYNANINAIVTTLFSDSYAPAVATLGHSLRKVNTTARLIALYFPEKVSPSALCLAAASGFQPVAVSRIAPPHNGKGIHDHFLDQFTKLSLWSLENEGINALVYVDADTLVLRNFDELFELPYVFAAAPDVWEDRRGMTLEFNAGVLFLRTSMKTYQRMLDVLPTTRFPLFYAEQAFLNQYFSGRTLTLPPVYNANIVTKKKYPELWRSMWEGKEVRTIHYTVVKPFLGPKMSGIGVGEVDGRVKEVKESESGRYSEEVEMWGKMWVETREMYPKIREECIRGTTVKYSGVLLT